MPALTRVWIALLLASIALLTYSNVRAYRLSFVHDESTSYDIVAGPSSSLHTSADHRLNTRMMMWSYHWLGPSEWSLRLPNLAGHLAYLLFCLLLLRQLQHGAAMVAGFALLNLNPFLQDFFSLARGYGLANGLLMGGLFFLSMAWSKRALPAVFLYSTLSMTCASLAVLANYTWLNAHLPLLAVNILLLALDGNHLAIRPGKRWIVAALVLIGANAWFVFNVVVRLFGLRQINELGNRGAIGFIGDTIGSLIETYFYAQPQPAFLKPSLIAVILVAVAAAAPALTFRAWQSRKLSFAMLLMLTLILAAAIPIAEHYLFDIEYPNERIALYYVPLAGVLAMFLIDRISVPIARRGLATVIGALMVFHFARTANLDHTLTWHYDARTKEAVREIARLAATRGNPRIRIGNNWIFSPTINYYRRTLHYDWLTTATRNEAYLKDGTSDLIYCLDWDLPQFHGPYTVIRRFPDTYTVLIEPVQNAPSP